MRKNFNKVIILCVVFMFTLSYGLTDKQVELVKKQFNLLQQKKHKDYIQTKSNLQASNI
jgi:hypothetical protein